MNERKQENEKKKNYEITVTSLIHQFTGIKVDNERMIQSEHPFARLPGTRIVLDVLGFWIICIHIKKISLGGD